MQTRQTSLPLLASLLLAACASAPEAPPGEVSGPQGALAFQRSLASFDTLETARTRGLLAAQPGDPDAQIRLALLHAQVKGSAGDLGKAQSVLEILLKSNDEAARALHPLARLLAEQLAERQRLENQIERQGAQLKESQRKVQELQEKIERLAEIERSLPSAARPGVRP